jgi:hypothetical protein
MSHDFHRDIDVLQRYRTRSPDPARMFLLRAGHLFVPEHGQIAPLGGRQLGKGDRERPDGAHHVNIVAKPVHMRQLLVQIEPCGPGGQLVIGVAVVAEIDVIAVAVQFDAWIAFAFVQRFENRAGPPMKVGIDNAHNLSPVFRPCGPQL